MPPVGPATTHAPDQVAGETKEIAPPIRRTAPDTPAIKASVVGVETAAPREIAQEARAGAATGHADAPMPRKASGGGAIPL